ncbi:hypothetical protein KY290_007692 [Solanum tuberosum]|uniref:NAC domain-containing protein n=1 Tax=Solanum tuberosum TaxID=4113 RepID=A0ABQ7W7M3_SOLTU|nr:hypothetical protein KY290_007692 [Solanum tuberosum]
MDFSTLGYRFHPSASEGLEYFYKIQGEKRDGLISTNLDVYGEEEPWEIYGQGVPSDDDRYFITKKNKGETEKKGTWKQPIPYKLPSSSSQVRKKKMHHVHKFGHWIMKQYQLSPL